ncbi:MAG TPA: alpha/beta hydrolase, partial [Polyangiales bacterium]
MGASTAKLHHSIISADSAKSAATQAPAAPAERARGPLPARGLLMLHGILGSGTNLRSLALQLAQQAPDLAWVLVDLRGHGRSEHGPAPHDVAHCATDLVALGRGLELEIVGVVGHSFGGKVALAYHQLQPELERVVLLDSAPFARPYRAGSEQTMQIIGLLERAPKSFATRAEFIAYVHKHGHSRAIADWLAMNLERHDAGLRLRVDLAQIRALLDDYFTLDLGAVLQQSQAHIDLLIAGRSEVYGPNEVARAEGLAHESGGRVRVHPLPDAGHWLHVDEPQAVLRILAH